MKKQYDGVWDWYTLANFRVGIDNIEIDLHNIRGGIGAAERIAYASFDEAVAKERIADDDEAWDAIDVANADIERVRKLELLLDEMDCAVEKMQKIQSLIYALGSPKGEVDDEEDEESDCYA